MPNLFICMYMDEKADSIPASPAIPAMCAMVSRRVTRSHILKGARTLQPMTFRPRKVRSRTFRLQKLSKMDVSAFCEKAFYYGQVVT